ncbi:hypothetical protein MRO13_05405 [Vibrio metschnikovii]|uniref:hypothetical protein n=1 Tax=Vibrio metschnikovii TaxID=28172 RepID=UPI00332F9409
MQNQKNLIQATADFEHWRQTRINKHASIPDELRCLALRNPLMILRKIINLSWIHILSCDQMISPKNNNQTTRCANSISYTILFTNSALNST